MSDPIADMLTRIRNAALRKHNKVKIPYSIVKENIAKVLLSEGFILSYNKKDVSVGSELEISLKYDSEGDCVIRKIKRISKPGLRVHKNYKDLTPLLNGQGVYIVSTSKGLVADAVCRSDKIGGEVLCSVY